MSLHQVMSLHEVMRLHQVMRLQVMRLHLFHTRACSCGGDCCSEKVPSCAAYALRPFSLPTS
jgi:hypothetical protein